MQRLKKLSSRREREYNYSQPGRHHILFRTMDDAAILGTTQNGITTLSDAGNVFLDVLGQAMQNFPCIQIHGFSVRPSEVELSLEITAWRNHHAVPPVGSPEWVYHRRTMTLPVFMGYLKTNSGCSINAVLGRDGGEVWARRYSSRVVTDSQEFSEVTDELDEEWSRVVVVPLSRGGAKQASSFSEALAAEFGCAWRSAVEPGAISALAGQLYETMILGRVLLLTGATRGLPMAQEMRRGVIRGGGAGGMAGRQGAVIRNVGPGRIFLSE